MNTATGIAIPTGFRLPYTDEVRDLITDPTMTMGELAAALEPHLVEAAPQE